MVQLKKASFLLTLLKLIGIRIYYNGITISLLLRVYFPHTARWCQPMQKTDGQTFIEQLTARGSADKDN